MPGDGAVNTGREDPLRVLDVELEALDGAPGSSALDHRLEERPPLLQVGGALVGVPENDVASLQVKAWMAS